MFVVQIDPQHLLHFQKDPTNPDLVYVRELMICYSTHHSKWAWALYLFKGKLLQSHCSISTLP